MSPRISAGLCSLLWFAASCATPPADERRRPNVVVFLADDLGWRDIGAYGQAFAETPRLDRLAREGTVFDAAYAACPVCSPTRAALLTGKYPPRVDITDWIPGGGSKDMPLVPPNDRDDLALEETTLAELLRARGYATFHVGKWHLGGSGRLPEDQGFDVNVMGGHIGHPASHFYPYGRATGSRPAQSHAVPALPPGGEAGEYLADRQATEAVRLITSVADGGAPFFLYLPFYGVHAPLEAPPELLAKYRRLHDTPAGRAAAGAMRPVHAAMVESLDSAVGRVLDALDSLGLAEDTLVVFTSDNGGVSGATESAPLRGAKRSLYEGGIRVPLIVRYPGVARAGLRSDAIAITQDVFATVAVAAGATLPPEVAVDARDLSPILSTRAAALDREAIYWHFPHYLSAVVPPGGAMRRGRFKLVESYGDLPPELYDLAVDPAEAHDLAASDPERVADLRRRSAAWRSSVGARMPVPRAR